MMDTIFVYGTLRPDLLDLPKSPRLSTVFMDERYDEAIISEGYSMYVNPVINFPWLIEDSFNKEAIQGNLIYLEETDPNILAWVVNMEICAGYCIKTINVKVQDAIITTNVFLYDDLRYIEHNKRSLIKTNDFKQYLSSCQEFSSK